MSTRSTRRAALQTTTSPKRRSTISLFKRIVFVLVPVFLAAVFAQAQPPAPGMYGSDRNGTLFSIDCNTGATVTIGGPINPVGAGSTEIEYDNIGGLAVTQSTNGNFTDNFFDMTTGMSTSPPVFNGFSHTSLEYVGPTLYSYVIGSSGGASTLHTLLPGTGTSTPIGISGQTFPISGLAYDVGSGIMYGISGGGGQGNPGTLLTANLVTGAATVVGLTGIGTFGSLQFCSDGSLLAGGDNTDGGNLYKINKATGAATLLAPSGFANVTGLTLVIGPTAAAVSVGGRVLTPKGRGIPRALVYITDQDGDIRTASTNHFGYFKFDEVEVGRAYIFNVFSKQYQFATQVVKVNDQLTDLNFIAQ